MALSNLDPLEMLLCDVCSGRSAVCGLYPRKMSREAMLERIRTRGHVTALCQHCGRVTCMRRQTDLKAARRA